MVNQQFNIIDRTLVGEDSDVTDTEIIEFCKILSFQGYPCKPDLKNNGRGMLVKEIPAVVWYKALEYARKR